ncbi:hypothetical protein TRIUR3_29781 [Triticum urartu]|uniref:Uncharacterized protein n=1 Tax=Triticum urartu TaxID=4572 RepID=M8A4J4_TRIUA|nr:hypothetical protein TRIUR3_29781 [Triticum urartu]
MVLPIKLLFVPATVFLSALIILSYFTSVPYLSYSDLPYYGSYFSRIPKCDIFQGEWVPDADTPPHYTNETCSYIQEHQNCMKYGRPDLEFLRWRWQPSRCDLPRFDADKFFRLVGNKTLAFAGDSLARNHMQSLLCLLSKVASPKELTERTDPIKIMHYERYNFTVKIIWSPFLVRTEEPDNNSGVFKLYLDEPDGRWLSGVAGFDYVILSGANWFTRQSMFYERGQLVGGSFVALNITSNLTLRYSHRMAFRTALRAINEHGSVKAKVIVRWRRLDEDEISTFRQPVPAMRLVSSVAMSSAMEACGIPALKRWKGYYFVFRCFSEFVKGLCRSAMEACGIPALKRWKGYYFVFRCFSEFVKGLCRRLGKAEIGQEIIEMNFGY